MFKYTTDLLTEKWIKETDLKISDRIDWTYFMLY